MSPEQLAQLNDLVTRLERLERGENVAFIKSIERNTSFVTQGALNALRIGDLADVATTTPSTGQVLKYNGTLWAPGTDNV